MKLFLRVIFYGLFANSVFSILDTTSKVKRHIWRGTPVSQTIEQSRNLETKGSRSNPSSLHNTFSSQCAFLENGLKAHPNNCQMYISCLNGVATFDTCSDGFRFNDITKECDFAYKVVCPRSSGHSARLHASRDDSYHDDSEYVETDRGDISGFKCSHEGIFEHPNDCTKFIQCAHSGLYVQSCGPGTMFNPSLQVCDWPRNVHCNKNVNSNIQSELSNQESRYVHNHKGQETRPVDAGYDFDFDVRMSDTNSRSNNNKEQQDRVYQNAHTQLNQRRINESLQAQQSQSHGTTEYARPGQRSFQFQPQTTQKYPAEVTYNQQHTVYPAASQGSTQVNQPTYTQQHTIYPDASHGSTQISQPTYTQQHSAYPGASQSRSFQSEQNNQANNNGIITSVQPLHNRPNQQNLVHSSPSYSKTRIYSPEQSNHQYTGIYPNVPTSSFSPHPDNRNADQTESFDQESISNRNENVHQTMNMLDSYANVDAPRRHDGKTNVMSVQRINSNSDHEIPIYNRPDRSQTPHTLRFTPRFSDDLPTQTTENVLSLNDALKFMLSPYTKSAPLRNDKVNEMTTKLLTTVENNEEHLPTFASKVFEAEEGNKHDEIIFNQEPIRNFNTINSEDRRSYANRRNALTPTPPEIIPNFNVETNRKIGNFPARTNLLLNNDQNKKHNRLSRPSYHKEEIEVLCSSGFDCGNGVCLSSEKLCNGRDDCGNRMDERNCKNINYEVRLSGDGDRENMGRVEVKVFDKWGYICDDKFGLNEANVFCREVGFPLGAVEVKANSYYPPHMNMTSPDDSPRFLMDELHCTGNETSVKDCSFNGWDAHDCDSEEIVGVVCKLPDMKCQLNYWLCDQSEECIPTAFLCDAVSDCSDGSDENPIHCNASIQYRLGNPKANHKEGRVEVRYKGIWGTVCDDDFGENEAKVFCRSLGYDGAAAVIKEFVEPGDGLIWLDQVSCIGNESSLEQCSHFEWGENNCNHSEDVTIRCFERGVETHQKLIMRESKSGFAQLNEIHHRDKSEQEHCGQIRVVDDQDDYDDQPVFKVIEGREAKRGHHPWQATIRVRGRNGKSSHWCGAVLISKTHVLTAAHCLIGFTKNAYFIRLGDHHSEVAEDTEVEEFIEDWHIHEKFRKGHLMNNDIAIIKLKSPVKFTDYIQPVCLPPEGTEYTVGKNCSISGWGSIQYGKSTPSLQLRSAHIPIMSEEICKESHNYGSSIQSGMFCAGIPENMIDACDGDSGGPFVCPEDGENGYHTLYGIISWGQRCGDRHKPGVYTKVVEYLQWIQQKLLL